MNLVRVLVGDCVSWFMPSRYTLTAVPMLPARERDILMRRYQEADSILEFGSGGSTLYALSIKKRVIALETDKRFYEALKEHAAQFLPSGTNAVVHVNIGMTGRYGMPLFFPLRFDIAKLGLQYVLHGYSYLGKGPALIFVDGRWRVSVCLYGLLSSIDFRKISLLLDDYDQGRGYYRTIEKYFDVEREGRMASLTPKPGINQHELICDFSESLADPN